MELISYGVEELSNEDAAKLMSRVHECRECTGQWVLFQKTFTVLSQTGQAEISVERSQQMWLTCLEHAKHKPIGVQHGDEDHRESHAAGETVPVSFRSDDAHEDSEAAHPLPSTRSHS